MGGLISTLQRLINSKKEQRILILGLDASGKTTLLYRFRLGEAVTTIPTIGFNVETVQYRNLKLNMWDVGGQQRIRPLWRYYFQGATAIIYVIDSADRARMDEVSEELQKLLNEDLLDNIPLLVFANKQDLPNAMTTHEIVEKLGLTSVKNHEWVVQSSVSTTGEGIYEGLDWLSRKIQ